MRVAVPNFYVDPHDAHDVIQKIIAEDARIPDTMADVVLYPLITCSDFAEDCIDLLKHVLCHPSVISIANKGMNSSYETFVIEHSCADKRSSFELEGTTLTVTYAHDGTAILKTVNQARSTAHAVDDSRTQALSELARPLDVDLPRSGEDVSTFEDDDYIEMHSVDTDADEDTEDADEMPRIAGMMYVSSDDSADDIARQISDVIRKIQNDSDIDEDVVGTMSVGMIAEPLDDNGNPMNADDIPDAIKEQIEEVKRALNRQGISFEVNDSLGLEVDNDANSDGEEIDDILSSSALLPYAYDPSTKQARSLGQQEQIQYLTAKLHAFAKPQRPDFYIMDTTLNATDPHTDSDKSERTQAQARLIFILGYVLDLIHTREVIKQHITQSHTKDNAPVHSEEALSEKDSRDTALHPCDVPVSHVDSLHNSHQVTKSESLKQFEEELLADMHHSDDMCPYSYN